MAKGEQGAMDLGPKETAAKAPWPKTLPEQIAAVQAALHQGAASERDRVVVLIDHQLDQLKRGGTNALVLETLRRTVLEVEA